MRLQVWREKSVSDGDGGLIPISERETIEGGKPGPILWWACYSAPGYMDRTESVAGDTAEEAILAAFDLFGDEEPNHCPAHSGTDGDHPNTDDAVCECGPTDDEIECAYLVNEVRDLK